MRHCELHEVDPRLRSRTSDRRHTRGRPRDGTPRRSAGRANARGRSIVQPSDRRARGACTTCPAGSGARRRGRDAGSVSDSAVDPPRPRPLLEVAHVARRLSTSEETVRRWLRERRLPAIRVCNRWRIDPSDLDAYLDAHRTPVTERTRERDGQDCATVDRQRVRMGAGIGRYQTVFPLHGNAAR